MKRYIFTLLAASTFYLSVFSQKPPMKFGKIDRSDLEMQYYELDSSASAVILCDYGHFNGNTLEFTRLLRIKILKKEGLSWADKVFPTVSKSDIRGMTYNLDNDEIVEEKLKPPSIYEEKVSDDYYRMRVAMPNVKVGSVFDIEFSHFFIPAEWDFQNTIPVKWSELVLEPTPYLSFKKNFFGYEGLYISEDNRWIGKDMPALKEEPYVNSIYNYITKFEFDILDIHAPGLFFQSFTTSWDAVAKFLKDNSQFGAVISNSMYLNSIAQEIKEDYTTDQERLKAAYEHIKSVKWNENEALYASSSSLGYVYKKQIGNSSDINIMLMQLLKIIGFETYPVIMSTRSNGILSPISPSLQKLNYMIVYANVNEKPYLLDATEELLPYYLLPKRCLNWQGRLIKEDNTMWIELNTPGQEKESMEYDLTLQEDMSLKGTLRCERFEYAAFDFRKKYKEFNSHNEFLEDMVKSMPGTTIINSRLEKLDSIYFPVVENYEVVIKNQIDVIDNEVYLRPMLCHQIKENPFKIEERKYPVDFAYPIDRTILLKILIPNKYEVLNKPAPTSIKLPENSGSFLYSITNFGNAIQIVCKFSIKKSLFLPDEYVILKEFYNQIIKKHSEPIIFTKI